MGAQQEFPPTRHWC